MFSVLTPTYNRIKELPRVYDSLKAQTFRGFEWIIVDDGSTDGTLELVEQWQNQGLDFKIIYHLMPQNKGKSNAVNEGFMLCRLPYTIIADSDDTFSKNTLHDLNILWKSIESTRDAKSIGAIWTLVEDESGKLVGEAWPKNMWQVGFEERVLNRKRPIGGEKWHCWRTEVLKEFKMYVHPNSFISEAATWNKINSEYDFLCVNMVHRRYWYSETGMIHQKKSYKQIQKVIFYTSYYHLKEAPTKEIITTTHYRNIAFNFIRSSFFVKDSNIKLGTSKKTICLLIFLLLFFPRLLRKVI
ncbi:glycosyltransferase family 2 protein [Maribacter aurantiacus]|uniref:Glycosyltransferase family 2 protein n=1 Tax=Maribacter aurantiacus TaxID=1882343 RepID=A0A5R8M4R4_9FLAO|nr:glycosyltransferase family 2 protein [Maribacter aurantiacus]TLF44553.1 glycosyltransferase family 2 protein [Maribacter aurantiacus]